MKQKNLSKKQIKNAEEYIAEVEQYVEVLEEQNILQKQIIENLEKKNGILLKQIDDYHNLLQKMLDDIHS